ncbi:MAG: HNH endonuclease [Aliiglaciecola sp.]|uniref:HNH endonuclease n=1 Tax=Aliiglaciecola sp. TaxID=1872441 RepID=UPI003297B592
MSLTYYIEKFQSIRPDRSSGHVKPHKVCLMFAIMDLIEQGHIKQNRIFYDEKLKQSFAWHFNRLKAGNDKNSPYLPFHHLQSSGFWSLAFKADSEIAYRSVKSVSDATIRNYVAYAFLDNELFDLLKSPITQTTLKNALISNLDTLSEQFSRWAKSVGKSDKTIKNYLGALKGSISNWANDAGISDKNLLSVGSYFEYQKITSQVYEIKEFQQKNKTGNGMYSAAINAYRGFLSDITQAEVQQDIEEIILDKLIPDTEKATLVSTRIGQGKYRRELIDLWQGCAVTRYQNSSFLVASHIKPWSHSSNEERLDKYNGLLLLANLDKAFDLGYVSFNDKGNILISEQLEEYQTLGIDKQMSVLLSKSHQDYLAFHREQRFKK